MSSSGHVDNGVSQGPFSLVRSQYQQQLELLEAFSHSVGITGIIERSKNVVKMPPEERFSTSIEVFVEGESGLDPENLDVSLAQVFELLNRSNENLQERMAQRIVEQRQDGAGYAVFLALLEELKNAYRDVQMLYESDPERELLRKYLSRTAAIYSRFVLAAVGEFDEFDNESLRDILRSEEYRARFSGNPPGKSVSELSDVEVEKTVLLKGAVLAYQRVSMTVSRGAELATVSRKEFEDALRQRGIDPNYGPSVAEDLTSGSMLKKE